MSTALLTQARNVTRPSREAMLQRSPSVQHFWNDNHRVFEEAWMEWEQTGGHNGIELDETLYAPEFRQAIAQSWNDPNKEMTVKNLWTEVFPDVYKIQFFDPEKLMRLREYFNRASEAGIPLRPPYGIVLNRGGFMLDPRSEGYLAAPTFQAFYRSLMDRYMRPVSRLLFPEIYGFDTQTFGFSIQWQAGKDTSLRAHTDASSVTLNINLNMPGEAFSGSAVRFIDPLNRKIESIHFEPGTALIHHGNVAHASEPITEGERHNLVLWLFGNSGQIANEYNANNTPVSAEERWTVPTTPVDGFAPF